MLLNFVVTKHNFVISLEYRAAKRVNSFVKTVYSNIHSAKVKIVTDAFVFSFSRLVSATPKFDRVKFDKFVCGFETKITVNIRNSFHVHPARLQKPHNQ